MRFQRLWEGLLQGCGHLRGRWGVEGAASGVRAWQGQEQGGAEDRHLAELFAGWYFRQLEPGSLVLCSEGHALINIVHQGRAFGSHFLTKGTSLCLPFRS